jgi:serine/threonine protein kinase
VTHLALHRDSVLIRPDGTVTITDLGIAAMWVERLGEKLRQVHSAWDAVYPEPGCVAPEILAYEPLGPKTDIYGLGALLFTLSTTQAPFQGRSVVAFNSILSSPTPPDPRSIYTEVDEELAEIIVACLHRNPDDRGYPDMASLAEALKPLAGDWPQVMRDYRAALMDNSWLERFEPRLRVVDGGDAQSAEAPIPAPAVIPLFEEPASPLTEAELLSRMTNQQRAVYLAGERQHDTAAPSQVRRGAILGIILAFLVGAYFFPSLWGDGLTVQMQKTNAARPTWTTPQSRSSLPSVRNRPCEQEQPARGRYNITLYLK